MKDFKFWVQGYNETLGEFSVGFQNATTALTFYKKKMEEINQDGGEVEFLKVSTIQFYNNRGE